MEDLGESVKTYSKTYRILENSSHLLLSNGIYYDKYNDVLFTPDIVYEDWYSRLLLEYPSKTIIVKDFYMDKPV